MAGGPSAVLRSDPVACGRGVVRDACGARARRAAVIDALALASSCADAAGASMRFASELPPPVYVERVRPTVLPPHVGPGFSGFQTRDHRRLVTVFRQLHKVRGSSRGCRRTLRGLR